MRRIFYVVLAVLVIFSSGFGCESNKYITSIGKADSVATVAVREPVNAKDINIIKDLDYVILEAKDNAFFGNISKLRVYQDRIFVFDSQHAQALFIYTIEGKHIATVGNKRGRGPEEFVRMSNFEIDYVNNQILAMDNFGWKFMIYDLDGNFIKRVNSDISVSKAVLLPNGNILHAVSHLHTNNRRKTNQIFVVDENNSIVKEFFEYRGNRNLLYSIDDVIKSQFDGSFIFAPAFRDTIFTFDEDLEIVPKYAIDLGNRHITQRTFDRLRSHDELNALVQRGSMCFLGTHSETDDFLYLRLGAATHDEFVFFNKNTNKTIAIHCDARITDYEFAFYRILGTDADGYFYGAINFAWDLDEFFKLFPEKPKVDTSEEMNPVVFKYKVEF